MREGTHAKTCMCVHPSANHTAEGCMRPTDKQAMHAPTDAVADYVWASTWRFRS